MLHWSQASVLINTSRNADPKEYIIAVHGPRLFSKPGYPSSAMHKRYFLFIPRQHSRTKGSTMGWQPGASAAHTAYNSAPEGLQEENRDTRCCWQTFSWIQEGQTSHGGRINPMESKKKSRRRAAVWCLPNPSHWTKAKVPQSWVLTPLLEVAIVLNLVGITLPDNLTSLTKKKANPPPCAHYYHQHLRPIVMRTAFLLLCYRCCSVSSWCISEIQEPVCWLL